MSLFEEDKNDSNQQHPENEQVNANPPQGQGAQRPANEYWVRSAAPQQRPTTPSGFGQGYPQQPPQYNQAAQGGYPPYNPVNFQNSQQQPPPQGQYQYNPSSGWQQPPSRPPENYEWNFHDYDKAAGGKTKKKKNRGLVVFAVALACVIGIGIISISAFGIYKYIGENPNGFVSDSIKDGSPEEAPGAATQLEIARKPQISESVAVGGKMTIPQVAKAVSPSVVGVIQYQPEISFEQTGAGSGIIMSADGYIITNAHVVASGTDFKVVLADGTPKDATLVGYDNLTDLAVLKALDVHDLTPAVFGNSNELEVGETVIAIGNPAGEVLAGSVTQGIISAVGREISSTVSIPLIQTDAAINPGNSGGALVNEYGQVIGINSSKIVATGFEGISFAIPISEAKPIIDDIVMNGRVTGRVKIGIQGLEIDEIDARQYSLKEGIRIQEIDPSSDLMNKGVQKFDIITAIDGTRIYTMLELKSELEKYKPGDKVTLSLYRQASMIRSEEFEVTITLIEDK